MDAEGAPFKKALRIVVPTEAGQQNWWGAVRQSVALPVTPSDTVALTFWARSPGNNTIAALFEDNTDQHPSAFYQQFALTPEWKQYSVSGSPATPLDVGSTQLNFHLSFSPGTVELGDIKLISQRPDRATDPTRAAPQSLIQNGDFSQPLTGQVVGNWGTSAQGVEAAIANDATYGHILQLHLSPAADAKPWDVQLEQRASAPVAKGETVWVRLRMRSPDASPLGLVYEASDTFDKYINETVKLTPQWTEYRFKAVPSRLLMAGNSQFKLFLGASKGTIEIAEVRVENYGPNAEDLFASTRDYWGGQAHDDAWKAAALARIEKIRKGDLTVKVVDARGRPISNANVKVEMTRHAFKWGTAIDADRINDTLTPDNARYRAELKRLYNTVVFGNDLKWHGGAQTDDAGAREAERALPWIEKQGFAVRGHNLVWGAWSYLPSFVKTLDPAQTRAAVMQHTRDYATRFRGKVYVWDAVNEAATERELWEKIGWDAFPEVFKVARAADPNVGLAYNDFNISNEAPDGGKQLALVKERVKFLQENHAPVTIIGDQAHISAPFTPLPRVLQIWDEMANFGLPLEITEFDVGAPDDAIHAEYVRDYLLAAFSHPAIQSFVQWGFWEGDHWRAKDGGAMFRKDWSKRPAQIAYEDLVLNQWWTRVQGATGKSGVYQTRGFLGDYQITVSAGKFSQTATTSLDKTGRTLTIKLDEN